MGHADLVDAEQSATGEPEVEVDEHRGHADVLAGLGLVDPRKQAGEVGGRGAPLSGAGMMSIWRSSARTCASDGAPGEIPEARKLAGIGWAGATAALKGTAAGSSAGE